MIHLAENQGKIPQAAGNTIPRKKYLSLSGNTSGRRAVSRRGVWFVRSNGRRSVSGTGWRSVAWCGAWFIFSSKAGSSTGSGRGVAWFISSSKAGSRSVSGRGVAWFISSSKAGSPAASGRGGAWLTGSKADAADALTPRGATFLSLDIRHRGHAFLLLLLGSFFPTSNVPADLHSIFFHDGHDKLLESLDRYLPVDFDKVSDILPSYNYYVSVEDFMTCWQTALDDSTTRLSFYFWLVNKFVFVLETSPVTLLKQGGIEKWYCFRPNKGVVLLTVDASLKGGEGGWGAVLRDHQLRVLDADCGTLYKAANIKIVTIAEAMCILCGIRLAVRYRDPDGRPITKVVGISDSLDVVTDFNKDPSDWDPKYAKIFGYIKYFASLLEEFTLQWAPRETNELANYLAGIGKTGAAVDRSIFTAIAEFDRSGVYFRTRQMKF